MDAQKQSGVGIASFIISLLSGGALASVVVIAGMMEVSTPGGIDENSVEAVALGFSIFAFLGMALVAIGLGIWGMLLKDRKKTLAILGTIFSGVTLVITASLIVLGLAAG